MSLRIGSLFAGIGGLELGLERAGLGPTAWQVENDDYCRRVLAKHWPDAIRYGDVREVNWSQVDVVDVVCGGFPCQPFSIAGERKGLADERWMWAEFARCVRALRPRYVVVENVTDLLRAAGAFDRVLADLAESGYDAEWDCLPAAAVGAPHERDRLFVVAYPEGQGRPLSAGAVIFTGDPRSERCGGQRGAQPGRDTPWSVEPDMGRVAYGVPARVDRLRALGNAVVPQVAEFVGRRILEAERREVAA